MGSAAKCAAKVSQAGPSISEGAVRLSVSQFPPHHHPCATLTPSSLERPGEGREQTHRRLCDEEHGLFRAQPDVLVRLDDPVYAGGRDLRRHGDVEARRDGEGADGGAGAGGSMSGDKGVVEWVQSA